MNKIVFMGKEYDSLADMPAKIRHNYFKARAGYEIPEEETKDNSSMMPVGLEKMPDEVRKIYERVRGELDAKPIKNSATMMDKLPKTEDLYRRSAPKGMQNMPSDEILYRPSPQIIDPPPPIIQSDHTLRRLLAWIAFCALLAGVAAFIIYSGGV